MTLATVLFALLFYCATAVLVGGTAVRILGYVRTPAPLKIPTTPAPTTRRGVALRLAREVLVFESLFKANLWLWVLGWVFHAGLALVLLRHLRYFTEPVWAWVALLQPFGLYAGFALAAALAGLWIRRRFVARVRYISTPSDHLMLALLLAIAVSGLAMKFVAHTDVVALKAFCLGLLVFDWQPLPSDALSAGAPRAGRRADAGVSLQQAAARARHLLLPLAQPGRRPARTPAPGRLGREARPEELTMAAADLKAPPLRRFPGAPQALAPGAMAGSRPHVANDRMQQALGFPGTLAEGWEEKAIGRMGELLGKYRSLKVYLDACVHCGACADKCHYFIGTQDPLEHAGGAAGPDAQRLSPVLTLPGSCSRSWSARAI